MNSMTLSAFESALAFIVLLGGAVGVIYGALAFVSRRRVRISVSGSPEVIQEANDRAYEAFVMYVRSGREDPVLIEACGIVAQDTRGVYWRLGLTASSLPGQPVSRGLPIAGSCRSPTLPVGAWTSANARTRTRASHSRLRQSGRGE
jgi:hypothetical protein